MRVLCILLVSASTLAQGVPGLRMNGVFVGRDKFSITFRGEAAEIACGTGAPVVAPYVIDRRGPKIVIAVETKPAPVSLTLQPDGRLSGPRRAISCDIGTLTATGPSGLRVTGRYAGSSGLSLIFKDDSVTLVCREASVARAYRIVVAGADLRIQADNNGVPVWLSLEPDGSIVGSGAVPVAGRDRQDTCVITRLRATGL